MQAKRLKDSMAVIGQHGEDQHMTRHLCSKRGIGTIVTVIVACSVLAGCPPRKPTPYAGQHEPQQWNLTKDGG